ncbi:hypothetical protein FQS90_15395 [Enterococcus casseliflavus]|uniref:DUF7006 family protein n=1 Tax=Enterococcus sp. 8E11_MSG4843 TaxID=1834190 RepID=UPI000B3ED499|nr:hypothetical protein [Enterococcus sp. 8E11_MSG4843]MBO1097894.1 hypothetical protein [Enterococcus casseliflavus]MBO1145442.1 hypothetical protein [Enterococcus casseliflavus]OUZ30166.1 hypothetical protein A5885_003347 [Enterococcus sp. 8E11_MSG4843]
MEKFSNIETYLNGFYDRIKLGQTEQSELKDYVERQQETLRNLISGISEETFWDVFPQILGLDSRLCIIIELIKFDEFSSGEVIGLAENDYKDYYRELCGYSIGDHSCPTIIFNVA